MDFCAELERIIGEVEGEEVLDSALWTLNEILGDTLSLPLPSSTPPPPVAPLGAAPHGLEEPIMANLGLYVGQAAPTVHQGPLYHPSVIQSGLLYGQAGAHSQGQHLPYLWPVYNLPGVAAIHAAPQPFNNFPAAWSPQSLGQTLIPVGTLNGEVVYRVSPPAAAAPLTNIPASKKRKRVSQDDGDRPYVKKPPNAFMLFRKEQRPHVVAELNVSECATVNSVLGQRWKSLPVEERAKYYEAAHREKLHHAQQFPEWSAKENYGKKRKRVRSKAPASAEASASTTDDVTRQPKRLRVTPGQTAAAEPSPARTDATEASHTETSVVEARHTRMEATEASHTATSVVEARHTRMEATEASHTATSVVEARHTRMDATETQVIQFEDNLWGMLQMLMDSPTAFASMSEVTQQAEELGVTPVVTAAIETPATEAEKDLWGLLRVCEMESPIASAPTSGEVTRPARRLRVTPGQTGATETPKSDPDIDLWALLQLCEMDPLDFPDQHPQCGPHPTGL